MLVAKSKPNNIVFGFQVAVMIALIVLIYIFSGVGSSPNPSTTVASPSTVSSASASSNRQQQFSSSASAFVNTWKYQLKFPKGYLSDHPSMLSFRDKLQRFLAEVRQRDVYFDVDREFLEDRYDVSIYAPKTPQETKVRVEVRDFTRGVVPPNRTDVVLKVDSINDPTQFRMRGSWGIPGFSERLENTIRCQVGLYTYSGKVESAPPSSCRNISLVADLDQVFGDSTGPWLGLLPGTPMERVGEGEGHHFTWQVGFGLPIER
eukprot:PhF_6_TR28090/c0_g1_i1/m.41512